MNKKTTQYALIALAILALAYGVYKYRVPRFAAGDNAPDFTVTLLDNKQVKLSDYRGKYVLLQFWGSWCGPCRRENPFLVNMYNKYHEKGFEILSIAMEGDRRQWLNAIEYDGMTWPAQAMESYQFDGPVTKQYNIKSIPATFLINPEGTIMGVNLQPDYIRKMLSEKLQ